MQVPHYSPGEEPKDELGVEPKEELVLGEEPKDELGEEPKEELVLGVEPKDELKKELGVEVNREQGPSISVSRVRTCTTRNTVTCISSTVLYCPKKAVFWQAPFP